MLVSQTVPVPERVQVPLPRVRVRVLVLLEDKEVIERLPLEAVIVPLLRVTTPTVSEKEAISRVPPETVIFPEDRTLLAPYRSVPALTVVKPV